MKFKKIVVLALLLGVFVSIRSSAQACSAFVVADPFDRKTSHGIDGLTAGDFEARIGGNSLSIVSIAQRFNSRLMVLVDVSGASEDPSLGELVNGIATQARQAPAGRAVAFGVFAEHAVFTKGFSASPAQRSTEIDQVIAGSRSLGARSALFDSLHEAISTFRGSQPGDAILIVSDGVDNQSKRNGNDLGKELVHSGIRLLQVFRPRSRPVANDFRQVAREAGYDLRILISKTGGSYTGFRNEQFFDFAWAGYLLEIKVPSSLDKPKDWKLTLRGDAAKAHKDALIYYPWQLACPQAPATAAGP